MQQLNIVYKEELISAKIMLEVGATRLIFCIGSYYTGGSGERQQGPDSHFTVRLKSRGRLL